MVYPALLPLMHTHRLPVVDRSEAPRRFKWTGPLRRKTKSVFCACAITFQTQSRIDRGVGIWVSKYLLLVILAEDSHCGFCFISDLYLFKLSSPFALVVYQMHVLKERIGRFLCSDFAVFQIQFGPHWLSTLLTSNLPQICVGVCMCGYCNCVGVFIMCNMYTVTLRLPWLRFFLSCKANARV